MHIIAVIKRRVYHGGRLMYIVKGVFIMDMKQQTVKYLVLTQKAVSKRWRMIVWLVTGGLMGLLLSIPCSIPDLLSGRLKKAVQWFVLNTKFSACLLTLAPLVLVGNLSIRIKISSIIAGYFVSCLRLGTDGQDDITIEGKCFTEENFESYTRKCYGLE
jgi:hypothetical protein